MLVLTIHLLTNQLTQNKAIILSKKMGRFLCKIPAVTMRKTTQFHLIESCIRFDYFSIFSASNTAT
jgi:hypothetical protein